MIGLLLGPLIALSPGNIAPPTPEVPVPQPPGYGAPAGSLPVPNHNLSPPVPGIVSPVPGYINNGGGVPGNVAPASPDIPLPGPGYVTNGDGGRVDCTPNFKVCWPGPGQR